ncbi:MAG: hypothetical protein RLZZ592_1875 [Pseudomonadota bacterium]|jgi:hypothetical protein
MTSFHPAFERTASGPVNGAWRPLLRTRLVGRAEPLFIDTDGLRSAASLWSGALVWAQLLRAHPDITGVVVWQTERLALMQLLVAALWDGRTVRIEATSRAPRPDAWCLDGRQVMHDGQAVCRLGDGGWPDLAGPARLSTLDMLAGAPMHGDLAVRDRQASHGDLWQDLGAPLGAQQPAPQPASGMQEPRIEVLEPFDLAALATPHEVLNDALLPLLRCTEVWERQAT